MVSFILIFFRFLMERKLWFPQFNFVPILLRRCIKCFSQILVGGVGRGGSSCPPGPLFSLYLPFSEASWPATNNNLNEFFEVSFGELNLQTYKMILQQNHDNTERRNKNVKLTNLDICTEIFHVVIWYL